MFCQYVHKHQREGKREQTRKNYCKVFCISRKRNKSLIFRKLLVLKWQGWEREEREKREEWEISSYKNKKTVVMLEWSEGGVI